MDQIEITWVDRRGREVDDVEGYEAREYFRMNGFARAKALLAEGEPDLAAECLQRTYVGADMDGIGLRWLIA